MPSSRPSSDDSGAPKRRRSAKRPSAGKPQGASPRTPREGGDATPGTPAGKALRARARKTSGPVVVGLVGLGLDATDGHKRITKGDDFFLVGGSAETHEKMRDLTIRLTERLKQQGKRIAGADPREIRDIVEDLSD